MRLGNPNKLLLIIALFSSLFAFTGCGGGSNESVNPPYPSSDALNNWHWRNPLPQGNPLRGVTYGNGIFIAVGYGGTILTSADGITWTSRDSGTTTILSEVTYGNGTFIAVGYGGTILTSADGITWTSRTSGTTHGLNGVAYGNGTFIAVGVIGTILQSDPFT